RITEALLACGATVLAVELHPDRAAGLRSRFAGAAVVVIRADATDLRLPNRPFKVVANPPFGAATALLRRLTGPRSALEAASIVLPAWAAARWTAGRGVGGMTSKRLFEIRHLGHVPRHAFRPPPPADAARILIRRTEAGR
ncbi:MAG TPA: rRNA adenine N-6-methyltransferase family protein, partial [Acidimicrobiales bacterium]|nr:rRNA adenine N-6-methyltransferase family protein [Acidimicrobiales bacterium]